MSDDDSVVSAMQALNLISSDRASDFEAGCSTVSEKANVGALSDDEVQQLAVKIYHRINWTPRSLNGSLAALVQQLSSDPRFVEAFVAHAEVLYA